MAAGLGPLRRQPRSRSSRACLSWTIMVQSLYGSPASSGSRPEGVSSLTSIGDVSEGKPLENVGRITIERQLAFERLVAELSAHFIDLPVHATDDAIRQALRRVAGVLEVERGSLYKLGSEGTLEESITWTVPNARLPESAL